jgi:hypothetical protein
MLSSASALATSITRTAGAPSAPSTTVRAVGVNPRSAKLSV